MPIEAGWHEWCESAEGQGDDLVVNWRGPITLTTWPTTSNWYSWTSNSTGTYNWPVSSSATFNVTEYTNTFNNAWRPMGYLTNDDGPTRSRNLDRIIGDWARPRRIEPDQVAIDQRTLAREAAKVVADHLLCSMLSEPQRQSWALQGYFEVIGSAGTLYRLHRGVAGNVEWIKPDGEPGGRLCAHPSMAESWLPTEDVMLAQMLALMTNEREFVRIANVHQGARPVLVRDGGLR